MFNPLKSGHDKAKLILIFILAAAAFILWKSSCAYAFNAEREYGGIVQMRLGARSLDAALISDMLEKRDIEAKDMKYLAWSQKGNVTVENYSLGRSAAFDETLCYYGDNHGFFSMVLDNGCALSAEASFKIFGANAGVIGETVIIGGENYIVEKLLYDNFTSVIYKVSEDNIQAEFDVLDIIPGEGDAVSVNEISMNYRVSGDIVIYYGEVIKFFSAIGTLLLWIAFITAAVFISGSAAKGLNTYIRRAVVWGGILLTAICCFAAFGSPVWIPDSFIPTRWSEFEFWSNTFTNYTGILKYYFSMKTYAPDVLFRSYIIKTLIFAALSAVCVIFAAAVAGKLVKKADVIP